MAKIEAYAANPAYRVIFEESLDEIVVTKIGPRGGVYE